MLKRLIAVMVFPMLAAVALTASVAPTPEPVQAEQIAVVYDWVPQYFCNPATGETGLFPYDEVAQRYLSPPGWSGPYASTPSCAPTPTYTPTLPPSTPTVVLTPTSTATAILTATPTTTTTVSNPTPGGTPIPTLAPPTSNTVSWSPGPDTREAVCVVQNGRVDKEMWPSSEADLLPYGDVNNGLSSRRMVAGKDCGVTLPDATPIRRALPPTLVPTLGPTVLATATPEATSTPEATPTVTPTATPESQIDVPDAPVVLPDTGDGSLATDVAP